MSDNQRQDMQEKLEDEQDFNFSVDEGALDELNKMSGQGGDPFDTDGSDPMEEPESPTNVPDKKSGKGSGIALIAGGVSVVVLLLGGLGYVGMNIVGGSKPANPPSTADFAPAQPQQPAQEGSMAGSASGFGDGEIGFDGSGWGNQAADPSPGWDAGADDHVAVGQGRGSAVEPESRGFSDTGFGTGADLQPSAQDAIDITYGADPDPVTEADSYALSDEEMMYDNLLDRASDMDAPIEAIKIDQNVIHRQVSERRLVQIEDQVATTRESIGALRDVVTSISSDIKTLSESVADSNANNQQLAKKVDELSAQVESAADYSSDLTELKGLVKRVADQATNAQRVANRAMEGSGGAAASAPAPAATTAKTTATAASTPAPKATPTPAPAPAPVSSVAAATPKPAAPEPAKPAEPQQVAAAGCQADGVSSLWSVKGVNATSAYVVRRTDKAGMFVREGIEVPGFGPAVSFHPEGRFICTTNGKIGR